MQAVSGDYEVRILAYNSSNKLIGDVVKQGLNNGEATKPFGFVYTTAATSVVLEVVDTNGGQTGFYFGTIYFDTSKSMGSWMHAPSVYPVFLWV
jgi:hypothetical protein